jgi:hypothetical protein
LYALRARTSEDERKRLLKHGSLSTPIREAVELYPDTGRSRELIDRLIDGLKALQRKNSKRASSVDAVRLINEDRRR